MAFFLKKLLAPLLFPLPLAMGLLLAGLLLTWRGRASRWGWRCLAAGFAWLVIGAYPWFYGPRLVALETRIPPCEPAAVAPGTPVVVLGGGCLTNGSWPINYRLPDIMLVRLTEGARQARAIPDAELLVSLGMAMPGTDAGQFAADLGALMNLDPVRIRLLPAARDTRHEAALAREALGGRACVLVTTASHMPRALQTFADAGVKSTPAPCGLWARHMSAATPRALYPGADSVMLAEKFWYETLGAWWTRLSGRSARREAAGGRPPLARRGEGFRISRLSEPRLLGQMRDSRWTGTCEQQMADGIFPG